MSDEKEPDALEAVRAMTPDERATVLAKLNAVSAALERAAYGGPALHLPPVKIVCESPEHPGRQDVCGVYARHPNRWVEASRNVRTGDGDALLDGDRVANGGEAMDGRWTRSRVRLECALCGRSVVRRGEEFDQALDEFVARRDPGRRVVRILLSDIELTST